ncbi:non-ribosomal peptide synthetase [Chitinophaga sancti]|uniref:Non-ribosomal peptide synthetase n=1 Tax=Chitinophaga sancti TaxID=1004 RepID=A0A1K1SC25_9BACT|nr:non-ribosomal peptide synthetase [Chitinophaga sancti]WQD63593.1 non-ribosomal peptide synthetase [Chitinophaga sancti]WQG90781.1 non-ribosomal peptide synthetase [Chitinophaga sancti]SFW81921.1 surfactin family lipopeptide synthetase A [Chitinophaga sancti]
MYHKTIVASSPLLKEPLHNSFPVTPSQKRMWIIHQLNISSTAYNSPVVRKITGEMHLPKLRHAFEQLLTRHEQLRASFLLENNEPVQYIQEHVPSFEFSYHDQVATHQLQQFITDFIRPFHLDQAPLFRACLIKTGDNTHILVIDMHHIISDLRSEEIIMHDLFRLYHQEALPVITTQYTAYASLLSGHISPALLKEAETFWSSKLSGELPVLELPADFKRPAVFNFSGTIIHYPVSDDAARRLQLLAAQQHVPLYKVCLTVLFVLLHKYSRQENIIIGMPREIRPDTTLDNICGLFINTLPVTASLSPDKTFMELLQELSAYTSGAEQHYWYDVGKLVEKYCGRRDPGRNPLYDVLYFHHKQHTASYGELQVSPVEFIHNKAELDLTFGMLETDARLAFSVEYYSGLFSNETITRLADHFHHLLDTLSSDPEIKMADISQLTTAQLHHQLNMFRGSNKEYPKSTIQRIFAEKAQHTPAHPALIFRDQLLTYEQLHEKTNQVANVIRTSGVSAGSVIGLMTTPSDEMIIAIMGVLKAGCTYLPIDVSFPEERIAYMLENSQAAALLVQQQLLPATRAFKQNIIILDDTSIRDADKIYVSGDEDTASPACIIYTSGTTGKPQGIVIRHFNIIRTVINTNYIDIRQTDNILHLSNYAFDASLFDIFGALLHGATLVIADQESRQDMHLIARLIAEKQITVSFMTTALFNAMVDNIPEALLPLRKLLTGGEMASVSHMQTALSYLGAGKLINMYGPTEGSVFSSYYPVNHIPADATAIPIGFPLSNTQLYIVNGQTLAPAGVPGELYIAGDGLAAGYLDTQRMQGKFTTLPQLPGVTVYRSGDLVKQQDDAILFIGRIDQQTKLRGFRIEPEEIALQLRSCPGIQNAVVIVKNPADADKYLQAFYTVKQGTALTTRELNHFLSGRLPSYMIPSEFTVLDAIPLTSNGKIDYRKLAKLPAGAPVAKDSVTTATTATERKIEAIWSSLLKTEKPDIHQNLFECGGHSLTATVLAVRLQQAFRTALPLSVVFRHPTIAGLATWIDSSGNVLQRSDYKINRSRKQSWYPLSFSETMVYVHQNSTQHNHSYQSLFPMLLEGFPDIAQLRLALQALVQRHEIFRTAYLLHKGTPVKRIAENVEMPLFYNEGDLEDIPAVVQQLRASYNLEQPPLFRAALLKIASGKYFLALANHHIISDGITETLFMQEISQLYQRVQLQPVRLQHRDYVQWQQQQWASGYYRSGERYWLEHLQGTLPVLSLPCDFQRPPHITFDGYTVTVTTDPLLTRRLQGFAASGHTSLFIVLFSAYTALLHKYTDQEDIIVGVPMANRMHADLQEIMGMFVNMIPWRSYPQPGKQFSAYLQEIKATAAAVYQHQDYPFEKLVNALQLKKDTSRNPLFDTIFALHNTGMPLPDINGLHISPYPVTDNATKVDLTVEVLEYNAELKISFKYSTALFKETTIQRMAGHYIQLLTDIVSHPDKQLREMNLLSPQERQQLLFQFNPSGTEHPKDSHLYQLFEQQVKRRPEHIAIRCYDTTLTYLELHQSAEYYADRLLRYGANTGTKIGIIMDRSPEMIVGIWAILRIGATYVPVDPDYPSERIAFMLQDSTASICLTTYQVYSSVNIPFTGKMLIIDTENEVPAAALTVPAAASPGPAYIMYTSGSTGEPKGVAIEHYNVIRTVVQTNYIDISEADSILQVSNYVFDGSVFDIFGSLLNGATLVLMKQESISDTEQLETLIRDNHITVMFITTALFNVYMQHCPECFQTVRKLLFGGEQVSPVHVKMALANLGTDKVIHVYGPTENTVFSTAYTVSEVTDTNCIPIGVPLSGTQAYVFNHSNTINPVGVPGELYLSGDGIGSGYWNRPALNKERFPENPFNPGTLLYKTGDLVKWQEDGNIVFLGRADQQVKIRGFRIEPGEIEALLGMHPDIEQCAVAVKENIHTKEKTLCAWFSGRDELESATLKSYLGKRLPHYMIPDLFIRLQRLPLNTNGKINRKALTEIADELTVSGEYAGRQEQPFVSPATPKEHAIAAVWRKVFGLEKVSIRDNFYTLGGHSLKALQVVSLLLQDGFVLTVNDLFNYPTIGELAAVISLQQVAGKKKQKVKNPVVFGHQQQGYPLSAVQQRFFQRKLRNHNIFNSPFLIALTQTVAIETMQAALQGILENHPVLTSHFVEMPGGQWRQCYRQLKAGDYFMQTDLAQIPADEHQQAITGHCSALQHQFLLTEGPLFKVVLFENYLAPGRQVLFFLFHHLISDGISWQVFIGEFRQRCLEPAAHAPVSTGASYAEWCLRLEQYAQKGRFKTAAAYWNQVLRKGSPFLPDMFPGTKPLQKEMTYFESAAITTKAESSLLHDAVAHYKANIFTILLSAFYCACRDLQERKTLSLYVMSAQRESFFPEVDIQKTVGFFAGAYPVCLEAAAPVEGNYRATVQAVKDTLLKVPKGGLDYFVLKHLAPSSPLHPGQEPACPVLFHYLNLVPAVQDNDFFTPLQLPAGLTHDPENPSAYLINITAVSDHEGPKLTFYYSQTHFYQSTIAALFRSFRQHLLHIINTNNP